MTKLLLLVLLGAALAVSAQDADCTWTIASVTQTRVSCHLPIPGFPPVSGADCLAFVLRDNNNSSTLGRRCEATTMCARETCGACDVVERSIQCHDYVSDYSGAGTSCVANREVRTQTLCNCRCYEYLYVISEASDCWQLTASRNDTLRTQLASVVCADDACIANFTTMYAATARLPIPGCILSSTALHYESSSGDISPMLASTGGGGGYINGASTAVYLNSRSSARTSNASVAALSCLLALLVNLFF